MPAFHFNCTLYTKTICQMTTLLKRCILAAALLLGMNSLHAADGGHRGTVLFDRDWKFHLGNEDNAQDPAYNDAAWRKLDLPHDWSIEGSFSKDAPATTGGGALPGGIGSPQRILSPTSLREMPAAAQMPLGQIHRRTRSRVSASAVRRDRRP